MSDDRNVLAATLLDNACLTLEQLCSACAVQARWVDERVQLGLLQPPGQEAPQWRFDSHDVWRVRQMRRLEITFGAEPELAALCADMMEELERLRAELRRLGE